MLKSLLNWWLESGAVLSDNLFAFRKGSGTLECLSIFSGHIYHAFNDKQFLVATFIDIRGAFDSVHILTLISHLSSLDLDLPPAFCNLIRSLFSYRSLSFSSPFYSHNIRSTFTGLPQGSCLSPILFNIYINFIAKHLFSRSHPFLIYADEIVIFSTNKSLNFAIEVLNTALIDLNDILNRSFFTVAPEKCKTVIFTRQRYLHSPSVYLDNTVIHFFSDVTYLGITLDSKLRWALHISSLSKFL